MLGSKKLKLTFRGGCPHREIPCCYSMYVNDLTRIELLPGYGCGTKGSRTYKLSDSVYIRECDFKSLNIVPADRLEVLKHIKKLNLKWGEEKETEL